MKKEMGAKMCLYPMPTTVVGTMVDGRPNYLTIAHVGIMDFETLSIASAKKHHSNRGIKENGCFSVNIPSIGDVVTTDYIGIVSGKETDKASLFTPFYGKLKNAPMVEELPVNMECRLVQTLDLPRHDIFIGTVVETYCEERVMTDGRLDYRKLDPILYTHFDRGYWKLGERFADAWKVGKDRKE
jgi:flavin reductase (DIM6/NTAB) family NADH-FMN oxidoreductase RutF